MKNVVAEIQKMNVGDHGDGDEDERKSAIYLIWSSELTKVGLDLENTAHNQFVADCLAKATNSNDVTVACVNSSSIEFLVIGTTREAVELQVRNQSIRIQLQSDDATDREHIQHYDIFGASVLERVRFRNVAPVSFEPIVLELALLAELGAAGLEVLDGAKLTVMYGSVILRVSDVQSEEHAARIMEWALATDEVAEAVESTIAEHVGDEPGIVSLLAHNLSAQLEPPFVVEVDGYVFAEFAFDEPITDTSGNAMAQMITASVRALTGTHVSCLFISRTLPLMKSLAHTSRWNYLKRMHASDFEWQDNPPHCLPSRPMVVCSADSNAVLSKAWSVIAQVLRRSPRDDLPAVSEPHREVVWRLPQQPSDSWLCVLQSGCTFDTDKMRQLCQLVRESPRLEVIDLCRAKGDGITVDAIQSLLDCPHVRYVAVAGTERCAIIRTEIISAIGRLIWSAFPQFMDEIEDHSGPDYHAHRRFFSFRRAATESIRDIRGHEMLAAVAGKRKVQSKV
jgi:hypothetical protein